MADIGLAKISYTAERQSILDYSHPIGEDTAYWISRPSGKLSPATNILRIFDNQSWLMIGVSILSVIAAFIVISRLGQSYGVETSLDNFHILIYPLATLIGENLTRSFKKKSKQRNKSFVSPGFARNGLLLLWTVAAAFISMAFLSMIRQSPPLSLVQIPPGL